MTALQASRDRGKESHEYNNNHSWPPEIMMENRRKVSSHAATITGNNWFGDVYPNQSRYVNQKAYQQEYNNEDNERYLEEKTSEETIADVEETKFNKNNFAVYPNDVAFVKPKYNNAAARERYERLNDNTEYTIPETTSAIQKLQRLRELQMKRDLSERYYSHEIKRLIGEYYFGAGYAPSALRSTGKLQSNSFQGTVDERMKNNLEPCGTMTTITRLYCGCIQETTRPIFTTARGRVQRRNCNQSQDGKLLKLTSSNPQEHLFSSLEQRKENYRGKLKKRFPMEPRLSGKIPAVDDEEYEIEMENGNDKQEEEIPSHVSRPTSPQRKYSDTSINSG